MRALIQRVSKASVAIANKQYSKINQGLCIFIGIKKTDTKEDAIKLVNKILKLRIFSDTNDKMNKSIIDIKGEILIISQFTLYADSQKGNRPSFHDSADKLSARLLYKIFINLVKEQKINIQSGKFGAEMKVTLTNNGPVTLMIET